MSGGRFEEWMREHVEELAERTTDSIEKGAEAGADPGSEGAEELIDNDERENEQLQREAGREAGESIRRPPGFWGQLLEWTGGVAVVAALIAVPYALGWRPSKGQEKEEFRQPPPLVLPNMGGLQSDSVGQAIQAKEEAEKSFQSLVSMSAAQEQDMEVRLRAFKENRFYAVKVPDSIAGLKATLYERRAEVPAPGETPTAELAVIVEAPIAEVMSIVPVEFRETIIQQIEQSYAQEVETRSRGGLDLPRGIDFGPSFGSFRLR
jgi:hypothetical protein